MQIYRRRVYMTSLEDVYNKVKQSSPNVPSDEWSKIIH